MWSGEASLREACLDGHCAMLGLTPVHPNDSGAAAVPPPPDEAATAAPRRGAGARKRVTAAAAVTTAPGALVDRGDSVLARKASLRTARALLALCEGACRGGERPGHAASLAEVLAALCRRGDIAPGVMAALWDVAAAWPGAAAEVRAGRGGMATAGEVCEKRPAR